ncbi:hypothetical protein [Vibrio mexicanus]|uniref:hypothetical protein n=1 Tax=Vibrio mexicanus TaxID=1004326 RepID=UPI00063C9DE9|nr:hypothetical protein [Vibrio mexicanus]
MIMKVDVLTVHCASVCLSIIHQERFFNLTLDELFDLREPCTKRVGGHLVRMNRPTDRLYIRKLVNSMMQILIFCRSKKLKFEPDEIMEKLQLSFNQIELPPTYH